MAQVKQVDFLLPICRSADMSAVWQMRPRHRSSANYEANCMKRCAVLLLDSRTGRLIFL